MFFSHADIKGKHLSMVPINNKHVHYPKMHTHVNAWLTSLTLYTHKKTVDYFHTYWGRLPSAFLCLRFLHSHFLLFFLFSFFFSGPHLLTFGGQILLLWIVNTLFTYCADTVHVLKNIKNGSHGTIYTFKNYFATVFSVFSFSNNKLNPNGPLINSKRGWVARITRS